MYIQTVNYKIVLFSILVALTSCAYDARIYKTGEIIQFNVLKLSNGIGNVNNFNSSGTFTCEKPGFYLVGTYIMSKDSDATFFIKKNGGSVGHIQVSPVVTSAVNPYHTGTGIIAVQLDLNDTLNIKAGTNMKVYGADYSCLTVIKVK